MLVTVSTPGKIYLSGEHVVVYGKPALLSCINKRVFVTVEGNIDKLTISSLDNYYIREIISTLKNYYRLKKIPPVKITVDSELKPGYHLGSSAAVAVATLAGLLFYLKKIWNPEIVNKLAYKAEKFKHYNPSGADNSSVTYGGFVWYRKELEFLKSIWQIPLKLSPHLNNFYLIDTGPSHESTASLVKFVAARFNKNKKLFASLFNLNEIQTKNIAVALRTGRAPQLIEAIRSTEKTLEKIGVVSQKVLPFIRSVEKSGGAAKILGGGGRKEGVGYLLCFASPKNLLQQLAKRFNYHLEEIILGEEGLRLESKK